MSSRDYSKVFLVTGANKGIGYVLCKKISDVEDNDSAIILTSRDREKGMNAVEQILSVSGKKNVHYQQLDVNDKSSIEKAANEVKEKFKKVDILVNNAGIFSHQPFDVKIAMDIINTNFYGLKNVTESFLDLIPQNGRIVNVSSGFGEVDNESWNEPTKSLLLKSDFNLRRFNDISESIIESLRDDQQESIGVPKSGYRVSKALVNTYTKVMSKELSDKDIKVVCVCPGWCRTDMGGTSANRSPEQGAESVFKAVYDENIESGTFWRDGKKIKF